MAFKKIRDLDSFDGTTPFNTGDYLAVSDTDGTTTRKATVKEVIETYNVQRAQEQEADPSSSGPELVEDSNGNLVSADPITAANIDAFVDPSSGLEVVEECSPGTDSDGNSINVCTKKLKLATSTEATTLVFYVWPQRAVCSKYTGAIKTNDVVTSSSVDTEDLYKNNTASEDTGQVPSSFVMFEPGVSKRTTDQSWGENLANQRAHPRFSCSGSVAESANKGGIVAELGISNDYRWGTTFIDFGSDPRMFRTDGHAYSAEQAVDINGNDIPFPSSISSGVDRRDYNELRYGVNTGSMQHWLYQIEFAANPYNKILTSEALANNQVYYLDDNDKRVGAVDYYFASLTEINLWLLANYGSSTPNQTNIEIILKEDCIERSTNNIFIGHWFDPSANITIYGSENQEAYAAGHDTASITMTTTGSNPNNNNAPRLNGNFQRTRRSVLLCPQRFGANSHTPNGLRMRSGSYRTYTEFLNFSSTLKLVMNRVRFIFDRPSGSFNFIASRGITPESASYFFRFSGAEEIWIKDTDIIQIGGSIFTAIEGETGSNIYFQQGGQLTTSGGQETPNHNLYTNVGYGGNHIPSGVLTSQEPAISTSSFDAAKVVPAFALQFIMRHKAYCGQLFYLSNSYVKAQVYNSNFARDAKSGFNPKGPIDSTVSGITGYEAMATRIHIATDALGGALGIFFNLRDGSTVEFNAPITTDPQGFVHWAYQEMNSLSAAPFQNSSTGQLYQDLFRFQKFNYGLVTGEAFSAFHHGQNAVKIVSNPGSLLYPHSNFEKKSFLDSVLFVQTSTIDHYDPADTTNYLEPESFACFVMHSSKNLYQSPYDNIGNCYPIMAHGGLETRTEGEIVAIWDSGNGGTTTAPILRRFRVTQDTTTTEPWPPDHPSHYAQITGDYTLPGKFITREGILYNIKTGDFRIVPAYIDLVIGIDEYLIFPASLEKDFVVNSQIKSTEISPNTTFGRLSTNNPTTVSNVFISETLNEASPLKKHANDVNARSMFETGYST